MSHCIYHSDRYAKKLGGSNGNDVSVLRTAEFPAPFVTRHETDAHFWPYVSYVDGQIADTQISVAVTAKKPRGIAANEAVLMHYLVVEYDAPGHDGFDAVQRGAFVERLGGLEPDSVLLRFACFYWTRAGARVVYRLRSPITYERYEGKVRGLLALFKKHLGVQMDPTSNQWWRCYRLPQVVRNDGKDDGPTWTRDYYDLQITEETIEADEVQTITSPLPWEASPAQQVADSGAVPDRDEALALGAEGSPFYVTARKALRRTLAWAYLFELSPIPVGHRDSMLVKLTGIVVSRVFSVDASPQHVYGLMLPMVDVLEHDGSEPWGKKLWRLVVHAWNAEVAKQEKVVEDATQAQDRLLTLARRISAQFPQVEIPDNDEELISWGLQRLVLVQNTNCYPFTAQGYYLSVPLRTAQIAAHMREHFSWLPNIFKNDGSVRHGQELLNEFGINLQETRYVARHRRGTMLSQIDDRLILEISPYQIRQEIIDTAAYDDDIADWWRATGHYETIMEWAENAVAVDEGGIAGLSLKGPKGCGKTLFALGLAEVWGASPVSGNEVFSRFNGGLLRSPVVLCDEGLPRKVDGMSVPDMYRTMVVGSDYSLESKYGAMVMCNIPPRFIFTANNPDTIKTLAGGRTLTRDDTEALAQRLIHLEFNVEATAHFAARGGLAHTRGSSRGPWIGGDPMKGGCRLARMIVWCYLQSRRNGVRKVHGRLLLEGHVNPKLAALLEGGGSAPDIAYVMCQDIEKLGTTMTDPNLKRVMLLRDEVDGTKSLWIRKADYVRRLSERLSGAKNAEIRRILDRWMADSKEVPGYSMLRTEELLTIAQQEDIHCEALLRLTNQMDEMSHKEAT